jgi:hypothetical protein
LGLAAALRSPDEPALSPAVSTRRHLPVLILFPCADEVPLPVLKSWLMAHPSALPSVTLCGGSCFAVAWQGRPERGIAAVWDGRAGTCRRGRHGLADPLPSVVGPAPSAPSRSHAIASCRPHHEPCWRATAAADGGGGGARRPLSGTRDLTRNLTTDLTAVDLASTARRAASSGRPSDTCSDLPCQIHGGVVRALSDREVFATSDKARLVGAAVASRRRQAAKLAPTLEGKRHGGWARHRAVLP